MNGCEEQINYSWIKQVAKQNGVSVNDLIVLAPQNDPFYTGTKTDVELGNWFASVWQRIGDSRAHVRRVHYWLVAQGNATFPNGRPYENTVECWDALNMASKAARYLNLVDPEAFNDRRTPEVMIYAEQEQRSDLDVGVYGSVYRSQVQLPDFPDYPHYSLSGYCAVQPYHLEVWCEKSTMNDVLGPLCESYGANLQTGAGEMSITATLALVRRLQLVNKPARILYVSDFDPAGQSMPVAVARKVEYFVRTFGLNLDIRIFPVVLTLEQVQYYRLPRTPIKESERRRGGFEARHGEGAVELDALEALYPGQLREILARYMGVYYDVTLDERVAEQKQAFAERLEYEYQDTIEAHQEALDALQEEYEGVRSDFEGRMEGYTERLRALWQVIKKDLSESIPDLSEFPVPVAECFEELGDGLYDSQRDYLTQIEAYKQFQGRD